ncbi:hypothetical protein GW952_31480 (plasmid) [Klebsiella michiganensis]|uniref:A-factor biosynthesis hotdog domain-containing protein n=1 Tax=Klebsiella michiganensis TaxID=1134687 RepID=A0A6P1V4S3_9ENTR|nr:AfsA-related hotdog domain-containing protein [Klebsiella michiganensis]QHS50141.1 hypothetical protein GW952_31480 [Klebsiella michiganensis]HDX8940944.1 hypothetical protein [Klebsiella michiganensis]
MKIIDFERMLPISLVHKPSNDSVLLTDFVPLSNLETLIGAQLPKSHGLYQENLLDAKGYDIAVLIEACRQSCFAIAHNQFELLLSENKYQFLFRELHAKIAIESFETKHPHGYPVQIYIYSYVEREIRTSGRTSGLLWRYIIKNIAEKEIAEIFIQQNFVDRVKWKQIREKMCEQRGVVFKTPIEIPSKSEINPSDIGRWNPHNLVLHRVNKVGKIFEALARFDPRHPVLFDRPTADHIFAMTQLEVGRQLAIYSVSKEMNVDPFLLKICSCDTVFKSMGELNIPTIVTAEVIDTKETNLNSAVVASVKIHLKQGERIVSVFDIGVYKEREQN